MMVFLAIAIGFLLLLKANKRKQDVSNPNLVVRDTSSKLRSGFVIKSLLEAIGVLLIIFAVFGAILEVGVPRGWHGGSTPRAILSISISLVAGIGFLFAQILAKLISSLLVAITAIWLFFVDTYRWENLKIYCLFFLPLLMTFWLRKVTRSSLVPRPTNAT